MSVVSVGSEVLDQIFCPDPPPFAVLFRPEATGRNTLTVLLGDVSLPGSLAELPRPAHDSLTGPRHEVLAVIPYRQIAERGYSCVDDGAPLIAMTVTSQATVTRGQLTDRIDDAPISLTVAGFDIDDATYAETVRRVLVNEIGEGVGANFVIKRSFVADISEYTPQSALVLFSRLLARESGAYWTFIVHAGGRTFVGATPERHVSMRGGTAMMNPISGTYRYPASGATLDGVLKFLTDAKETDELYMVVDEELKMMAQICSGGGRVVGPYLREMAQLAHTEYFIEGHSVLDPRDVLRETMFAPTVTGGPLESACRVISRYEPEGRGYYSGAIALIGRDEQGEATLDSAILIRSAEIDSTGRLRVGVGATLVRHSRPEDEVLETRAKAASLITALQANTAARFGADPRVQTALAERNSLIAKFWRTSETGRATADPELAGRRVLVVDAEDTFTSMLDNQLCAMGLDVTVRRFDQPYDFEGYDLVVMGPGPGDPRDLNDPKIAHMHAAMRRLIQDRRPLLAVCLSHQVLSMQLGLSLVRRAVPNQGLQLSIDLFGTPERVGFYNAFAALSSEDKLDHPSLGLIEISREVETGEVHALRGHGFASVQFHAESVLTQDGPGIIAGLLRAALTDRVLSPG
ncbi:MAG TPA: anthranilate synthase family protein [Jatrophihabitans sp.]|jgi:phenazine biosynthesis protein phzE|uniref:anthranilate synthase family protein n=1 Tax=Jatrophihabitans sp. TaxID=1932789 RepID=UPI002EEFC2F2